MGEDLSQPASWRTDPTGRNAERYWDGARWSDHVRTNDIPGVDPYLSGEPIDPPSVNVEPLVSVKSSRSEQLAAAARAALIAKSIAEGAASDAGLLTKKGKMSKFGIAKAAIRPVKTGRKVAGSVTSAVISNVASQNPGASTPEAPPSEL